MLKRRVKAVASAITAFDIGPEGGVLAFGTSEGVGSCTPPETGTCSTVLIASRDRHRPWQILVNKTPIHKACCSDRRSTGCLPSPRNSIRPCYRST